MRPGVTVCIPSIPPRAHFLNRAISSVTLQTRPAAAVSVAVDLNHDGAWVTRDRALRAVQTEWVAFLDDDDWFLPSHLDVLTRCAAETGADYVYSWYVIQDRDGNVINADPLGYFGKAFDPDNPTQTTITTLVRTELAQEAGFQLPTDGDLIHGQRAGEDWNFTLRCLALGARIVHVPERTWIWSHHGANTSGMPSRW